MLKQSGEILERFVLYKTLLPSSNNLASEAVVLDQNSSEFAFIEGYFERQATRNDSYDARFPNWICEWKVKQICRLENAQEKTAFLAELKADFAKYTDRHPCQLIKLMFTDKPKESLSGCFGTGFYFEDSVIQIIQSRQQQQAMNKHVFVSFVLPGTPVSCPDNPFQLTQPPLNPQTNERFDSVCSAQKSGLVTYK